jgi:hypothetical protein
MQYTGPVGRGHLVCKQPKYITHGRVTLLGEHLLQVLDQVKRQKDSTALELDIPLKIWQFRCSECEVVHEMGMEMELGYKRSA